MVVKFRRLKIVAHPHGIAFSMVTDQESGEQVAGVASIAWSTAGGAAGESFVILKLHAQDVAFSMAELPQGETNDTR